MLIIFMIAWIASWMITGFCIGKMIYNYLHMKQMTNQALENYKKICDIQNKLNSK